MDIDPTDLLEALVARMNADAPAGISFRLDLYRPYEGSAECSAEISYRWKSGDGEDRGTCYFASGADERSAKEGVLFRYLRRKGPFASSSKVWILHNGIRPAPDCLAGQWPVAASSAEELALKLAASGGLALSRGLGNPGGRP